jgi:uncharacterized protein
VQDDVEAAGWFQKAAEQGQAEAQLLLGTLFFWGAGVPHSYVMTFAWCEIAQAAGEADALECRDAALEHMTSAEMKQSFRLVIEWRARHWGTRNRVRRLAVRGGSRRAGGRSRRPRA